MFVLVRPYYLTAWLLNRCFVKFPSFDWNWSELTQLYSQQVSSISFCSILLFHFDVIDSMCQFCVKRLNVQSLYACTGSRRVTSPGEIPIGRMWPLPGLFLVQTLPDLEKTSRCAVVVMATTILARKLLNRLLRLPWVVLPLCYSISCWANQGQPHAVGSCRFVSLHRALQIVNA